MTTQKQKDLKDQYQVADLKEYDVMHTCTTAYPSRRVITGEQWSERIYNKMQVKSTPPSPVEKVCKCFRGNRHWRGGPIQKAPPPPKEIIKRKITGQT